MEPENLLEFRRIHFAKVKLNKEKGIYEIIDHFNKVSFTGLITEGDQRCVTIVDLDHESLFHVVQITNDDYVIKSPFGENLGFIGIHERGGLGEPTSIEVLNFDKELRFRVTKLPLIERSNEYQVISMENGDLVGRMNVVRSKAISSMQPEVKAIHKVRILSCSILLLGIFNQCW